MFVQIYQKLFQTELISLYKMYIERLKIQK